MVRGPDELTPVVLGELDPGLEPLFRVQKLARVDQKLALDSLAVATALAVTGCAAELDGLEIGRVGVEQR